MLLLLLLRPLLQQAPCNAAIGRSLEHQQVVEACQVSSTACHQASLRALLLRHSRAVCFLYGDLAGSTVRRLWQPNLLFSAEGLAEAGNFYIAVHDPDADILQGLAPPHCSSCAGGVLEASMHRSSTVPCTITQCMIPCT